MWNGSMQFPFDPIERAREVEELVMRDNERKYYRFRYQSKWWSPSVADSVGCCLNCVYCWNFKRNMKLEGTYRSPRYVAGKLKSMSAAHKNDDHAYCMRTGGCEPILGNQSLDHLISILEWADCDRFLIATNGIMFGHDLSFLAKLKPFRDIVRLRICAKAHDAATFETITGADKKYFGLPFNALHEANRLEFHVHLASMPQFVDQYKLRKASGWKGEMNSEDLPLYPGIAQRLRDRGLWKFNLQFQLISHLYERKVKVNQADLGSKSDYDYQDIT